MRAPWMAGIMVLSSVSIFYGVGCEANPDGPSVDEAMKKAGENPDWKPPTPVSTRKKGAPSSIQTLEMIRE